ncbi:MAG TPA: DNA polymerase III subunit delta [Candidatus Kapabacteria bacterium]|nr:DNA polymerase III subunit delta [Candidatus Kapabacteria bacterium]
MPIIAPNSLETAIKHGKFDPVYFLFGDEEFLIEEAAARLIAAAVDESTRSFNYDLLHGSDITVNDIVERASAYPLMAERRVVVVKEIDRTFALRGKPDDASPFARYLRSPSPSTLLLMTAATSDILSKGKGGQSAKAPYNLIVENGSAIHYKKIYDREIPSWTAARIKSRGKEITPDAVELFIGYTGASLRVLNNEIEKLFTFVEDRKRITAEDVRAVVGASKVYNVFELQKAVGAKNLELTIEITDRMLGAGESEQLILTMLSRYFSILWRLVELRTRTKDTNELARGLSISSFFINEYQAALSRYPMAHLRNAFESLLQADIVLKTSRVDPGLVLQLMLTAIVRGERMHGIPMRSADLAEP